MDYMQKSCILITFLTVLNTGICWRIPQENSFLCYHCGSETDTGLDYPCEKFTPDHMFEGHCGNDNFCVKTVSRSGRTVRGCAMKGTASYYKHEVGCDFTKNYAMTDIEITCFCDTPLCNGTPSAFLHQNIIITNLLLIVLIKLIVL